MDVVFLVIVLISFFLWSHIIRVWEGGDYVQFKQDCSFLDAPRRSSDGRRICSFLDAVILEVVLTRGGKEWIILKNFEGF